jgi:hypothetical protein
MADQELEQYPRGQVAYGGGNLQQCTNVSFTATNGAKVQSTLARNPSGVVVGNKSVEVSGDTVIDTTGPERDWFSKVSQATPGQMRFKFPGGITKTVECVVAEVKGDFTLEDPVKVSFKAVGRLVED